MSMIRLIILIVAKSFWQMISLASINADTARPFYAKTFFSLAKRGRESTLTIFVSPWIRGSA